MPSAAVDGMSPRFLTALLVLAILGGCEQPAAPSPSIEAAATARPPSPPVTSNRLITDREALSRATVARESRPVLPPTLRRLALTVPPSSHAKLRVAVDREAWRGGLESIDLTVTARVDGADYPLLSERVERPGPGNPLRWQTIQLPLERFAGRQISLLLGSRPTGGPANAGARVLWTNPRLLPDRPTTRRIGTPPNLILISIDTLRPDRLGAYGYDRDTSPNTDRLAREGVLFRQAISPSSWTLPAHASLFTGLLPHRHGAVRFGFSTPLPQEVDTLAELLWDAGYDTAGFADGGFVTLELGFDQGFDVYGDPGLANRGKRRFTEIVAKAEDWLAAGRPLPFFLFLHTYEVHLPYQPPPPYDTMFAAPGYTGLFAGGMSDAQFAAMLKSDDWIPNAALPQLEALYDGGIRSMDAALGELLALLDRQGLTDSTCVVLTSDHGEEFREHGSLFHRQAKLYEENVRIPLIVRCPGRVPAGRVVEQPVSLIDLMPTLLELAGAPVPAGLDAHSLLPALTGAAPPADRPIVSECDGSAALSTGVVRALRVGNDKLIESSVPVHSPLELFDLAADPGEQRDLHAGRPDAVADLRAALAVAVVGTRGTPAEAGEATLDEAAREHLRALGYDP